MSPHSFRRIGSRIIAVLLLSLFFLTLPGAAPLSFAQTTQPYLFASTSNGTASGLVTLLRDSTTGVLTMVPNTTVFFKDPCSPNTIDPTGNFLLAACGDGVAMYTLDSTTGIVAETLASPYSASNIPGQTGVLVVAESTGQYVYLLKVAATESPTPSTFTLDTFQIDANTPALVAVGTQTLSFNGTWVASVGDPARHGMFIFVNQEQGGVSPAALLFAISFDPSTGLATIPASGLSIGSNARSIAMSPAGGYLAMGSGDTTGSLTVYQVSTTNLSMSPVGTVDLGFEDGNYGSYTFPDSLYFSPGGNLLYVQAPPANLVGEGSPLPFLVYDPTTVTQLAASPIQDTSAIFLSGVADPQAPFTYVGNSGPATFGISVYQVDLSTGQPSQPAPIAAPFFPATSLLPLFVTVEQSGQGIQGPTLGTAPGSLTFGSTTAGQSSAAQDIVLKSLGAQAVSLSSIQISGANSADFIETDNCISSPVLPTNHSCTIAITYAPANAGSSQATLIVTDNAAGSPQTIPLVGTAVAPIPPAPAVTLNPAGVVTFPGTPTQGTSTAAQTVTLTNSGGAPLQILSAVLNGFNAADFSISSDTCSGSIAANASCNIALVFSPLASGIRSTTLTITDNAANSPQSISLSGTALPAATVSTAAGGSTIATLTAGQTTQFNLQATPGAGFNGTLSFTCAGAPFGATCTVPASIPVTNGALAPFTVSISTLGASVVTPTFRVPPPASRPHTSPYGIVLLAFLCTFLLWAQLRSGAKLFPQSASVAAAIAFSLALAFSGIGCGSAGSTGGSSQSTVPGQTGQTVATPSIQPNGGVFGAAQSVSITDTTSGAIIYYTTDGSTPSSASPVYSSAFTLNSVTTVQAIAVATGDTNSSVGNAIFKFRTPPGTYPITITVSATPAGSSKVLQLNPISLTLIVN
ncbi:MAG: choice-of-anchor D domain-containing protein [Candidatus Acidiferrum sp.]